jgi:hypothetical protein
MRLLYIVSGVNVFSAFRASTIIDANIIPAMKAAALLASLSLLCIASGLYPNKHSINQEHRYGADE